MVETAMWGWPRVVTKDIELLGGKWIRVKIRWHDGLPEPYSVREISGPNGD